MREVTVDVRGGAAEPASSAVSAPIDVAFLAQEDIPVPAPIGASVSRVVYELARNLPPRFNVTVCGLPHPELSEGVHEGVRYVWAASNVDQHIARWYDRAIRAPRRLGLRHRPQHGTPFHAAGYARNGLRRLQAFQPQVVHLQTVSQLLPVARRRFPAAKLVLHMHCDWLRELPRAATRRRLQHADLILGVSEYITDGIREAFPEHADRCRSLYNGVDVDAFTQVGRSAEVAERSEALRRELGLGEGPVVLFVKAISPETGLHVLLQAFDRLRERIPGAKLVIIGWFAGYNQAAWIRNRGTEVETPRTRRARADFRRWERAYPGQMRQQIDAFDGHVVVAEKIPHAELPAWYGLADVMAVPSVWNEPFTLVALEASAAGLPVVASRRGGLPEFVQDGVTGMLVRPGDPVMLADALASICLEPSLARRMGEAGRTFTSMAYSWEQQSKRLGSLYEALVAGDPLPA